MIFWICIILAVIFTIAGILINKRTGNDLSILCAIIATVLWLVVLVMAVIIFVNNTNCEALKYSNEKRYESLCYQLQNNIYDNDNDLGKKELYDQVTKWNEDLAYGKKAQRNLWVGIFYPNIYDEFEFIEFSVS